MNYPREEDRNPNNLRIIKTARTVRAMNSAAKKGFFPLVKKIQPSEEIRSKFSMYQNKKTGRVEQVGDFRAGFYLENTGLEQVITSTWYYPYKFALPFAAYLIPSDIGQEERVWLEDLIEDYVGSTWNQGDVFRLEAAEAIWTGNDFQVLYDPEKHVGRFFG